VGSFDKGQMGNQMHIGLVGIGYWGKNILRNLLTLDVKCTACDFNKELIHTRKQEFPGAQYTLKYDDILSNKEIKAVIIATPASTHFELAKQLINAQKDILVEKPLALDLAQGRELEKLAKLNKKILMVGHILYYHPAICKIKELIDEGALGNIQYIYSNRLNIGKLRTEENILWSFAPHDISAMLMFMGEEPSKVSGFGASYINKEIYDITVTTLNFSNGVKGHIFVSWLHPYKEQKFIIVGSKAMVVFDDLTREKIFIYPHKIKWIDSKTPVAQKAEHYTVVIENKEPLREELLHFIDCVKNRKLPRTDAAEGVRVLKVLKSVEKSLLRHST